MSLEILLNTLNARVPFPVMRAILNLCDLPMGRGGVETIKKVLLIANDEKEDYIDSITKLKNLYDNHLLVSEKATRFFSLDRETIDKLIIIILRLSLVESEFKEAYPLPVSEDKLVNINSNLCLVKVIESEEDITLIYCSTRLIREEVKIDTSDLSLDVKKELSEFKGVYGIKEYDRQLFDVVVIGKKRNYIEVRVDISEGISLSEKNTSFALLINEFNKLIEKMLGIQIVLNKPVNLFPLIDKLYTSTEGRVADLAFTTDQGSIKSEKMRRGMIDLRNEAYHKAGREAVDHISPYRLAIIWERFISKDINTYPEILLAGHLRSISSTKPVLEDVLIKKCCFLEDYSFVFKKIISYL